MVKPSSNPSLRIWRIEVQIGCLGGGGGGKTSIGLAPEQNNAGHLHAVSEGPDARLV